MKYVLGILVIAVLVLLAVRKSDEATERTATIGPKPKEVDSLQLLPVPSQLASKGLASASFVPPGWTPKAKVRPDRKSDSRGPRGFVPDSDQVIALPEARAVPTQKVRRAPR